MTGLARFLSKVCAETEREFVTTFSQVLNTVFFEMDVEFARDTATETGQAKGLQYDCERHALQHGWTCLLPQLFVQMLRPSNIQILASGTHVKLLSKMARKDESSYCFMGHSDPEFLNDGMDVHAALNGKRMNAGAGDREAVPCDNPNPKFLDKGGVLRVDNKRVCKRLRC